MFDSSSSKTDEGSFPNIILKKKLAPLPLFKQNILKSPTSLAVTSPMGKTSFGFRSSAGLPQTLPPGSPTKTFLNELKTINHYGRLCDQPFLEFSNFHFEQVFGSGSGHKKIVLEPIQQRKERKLITKLHTIGDFNKSMRASTIRTDDARSPGYKAKPKAPKKKENPSVIKKAYVIGEHELTVGFYSLEVVLTPSNAAADTSSNISLRLGKKELKRLYKKSHNEIVNTVIESLAFENGQIVSNIHKNTKEPQSGITPSDAPYPEKRENLSVVLNGQKHKVVIHFPYLDIVIPDLNFNQKMVLKPINLANLYEAKFNNLDDYVQRFQLPPEVYMTKDDLRIEELKNLPTIIKKVIKTTDFGGLMLFKGLEVHLTNTSDQQPETIMHESMLTPMNKNILKRKKKDVNNVLLRLNVYDLERTHKCTADEISQLIQESIVVKEGEGFALSVPEEKTNAYAHRHSIREDSFPEFSEKFNLRFNRFVYECYIKYPTLELYVPETNFKDVIQLKPSQLKDLIDGSFKNMESYLDQFRVPVTRKSEREQKLVILNPSESEQGEEILQQIANLAKNSSYQAEIVSTLAIGLEEDVKKLQAADHIIVSSNLETDEELQKIKQYFEAIKEAYPSEQVLRGKKIFFVQKTAESSSIGEDRIKQIFGEIFEVMGVEVANELILTNGVEADKLLEMSWSRVQFERIFYYEV